MLKAGALVGLAGGALDASTVYPLAYPGLTLTRLWQGGAAGLGIHIFIFGMGSAFVASRLLHRRGVRS